MAFKYRPSKKAASEFKDQMQAIETYCDQNNIKRSMSSDSYYFILNGINYRVSNHSIEASDKKAYDFTGTKVRDLYHDGRDEKTIYIHASKTRIIEIYNNLVKGVKLDGRGNPV